MFRLILLLFSVMAIGFNQLSAQEESTCYQRYAKVFEVRGADAVQDGWHENVVITIRKGSFAECLMGKVLVKNGMVDKRSIALKFVNDQYEKLDRAYKYDEPTSIFQGISKTMVTLDEELINIMFVDAIKPKKKAFERAPDPSTLYEL